MEKNTHIRLPKTERIKLQKDIEQIFSSRDRIVQYPIKLVKAISTTSKLDANYKVMFIVPKRLIRKAVVRNSIRRRMREIYRLNKNLLPNTKQTWLIAFIYTGTSVINYAELEQKIILTLQKLKADLTLNSNTDEI